jgi:hypothetical protein
LNVECARGIDGMGGGVPGPGVPGSGLALAVPLIGAGAAGAGGGRRWGPAQGGKSRGGRNDLNGEAEQALMPTQILHSGYPWVIPDKK